MSDVMVKQTRTIEDMAAVEAILETAARSVANLQWLTSVARLTGELSNDEIPANLYGPVGYTRLVSSRRESERSRILLGIVAMHLLQSGMEAKRVCWHAGISLQQLAAYRAHNTMYRAALGGL